MNRREYLNTLFDIYKELLTKVEQETFIDYYFEDLSLQEIADNRNITKSSVGKTLNQVENKLENWENILNVYKLKKELKDLLKEDNNLKEGIAKIIAKY